MTVTNGYSGWRGKLPTDGSLGSDIGSAVRQHGPSRAPPLEPSAYYMNMLYTCNGLATVVGGLPPTLVM